jgi:hypothetical protein
MYTQRLSEALAVVSCIDPDAYAASATPYSGDVIDMDDHNRVMFIVQVGTMAGTSTVDFGVYGDTSTAGSFTTLITGKSITQLTQAGTDSDKQAIVEVTAEEVKAQGERYLKGKLTVGTAASDCATIAIAGESRFTPASGLDLSSVDEIVA